jgi:glycosyltransferase involved in cell wall biosynthesis
MHIVGISRWISECARRSSLFRGLPVTTIANNVDTRAFMPMDKAIAKQRLELAEDRKVLLVGARNVSNAYKGFDLFLDALKQLDKQKVQVLLFGKRTASIPDLHGIPSTNLGFLGETTALQVAYSAADVFIAPSRADAFGKTLVEAMACGTPVVCFDATGPRDVVGHRVDGYRAKPFSSSDLAKGMNWILNRPPNEYKQLCHTARINAERKFDSRVSAAQYVKLYEELLHPLTNGPSG